MYEYSWVICCFPLSFSVSLGDTSIQRVVPSLNYLPFLLVITSENLKIRVIVVHRLGKRCVQTRTGLRLMWTWLYSDRVRRVCIANPQVLDFFFHHVNRPQWRNFIRQFRNSSVDIMAVYFIVRSIYGNLKMSIWKNTATYVKYYTRVNN